MSEIGKHNVKTNSRSRRKAPFSDSPSTNTRHPTIHLDNPEDTRPKELRQHSNVVYAIPLQLGIAESYTLVIPLQPGIAESYTLFIPLQPVIFESYTLSVVGAIRLHTSTAWHC